MFENGPSAKPRLTRRTEKLTKPRVTITIENHKRAAGTSFSFREPMPRFSATTPTTTIIRARAYRRMIEPPGGLPDDTLVGAFY